jgi:hypothetical protein
MEVLFCFLNWVSSFHTVDEETGNKMDTWNIATVMAPNILRESNDKEVKSVDQGAVKVVFDLIENNDEFSEVCNIACCCFGQSLTRTGASRNHGATQRRSVGHERERNHAPMGAAGEEPSVSSCAVPSRPDRHCFQERSTQRASNHNSGQQPLGPSW